MCVKKKDKNNALYWKGGGSMWSKVPHGLKKIKSKRKKNGGVGLGMAEPELGFKIWKSSHTN